MTETSAEARRVVVEREFAHPPEKLWRALTQPHLVAEWLMAGDIAATPGHHFSFGADWGHVDCEVITVEPERILAYSWAGSGLESVVTWTLTATATGTRLRMVQTGFTADNKLAYHGARAGWPRFLNALDAVLERVD
ncbi:MAG: SRPBCC domain-containing protein [Sphingopyxis sp.]|uniref:SRPBCC family protein n=1 Tax=Sphingopyxis sp. TaxID=1908224 RepID=UPI002AB93DE9|nr:SRPBCC domain-containing protein [Sphingopyxis sp.]MDZ3830368.1 SRPBCC domain-containing protein [Sphingopyxis sp.]